MKLPSPIASVLPLLASACAFVSAQDSNGGQKAAETAAPASTEISDPMASFARMESGEWRRPALTKVDMFETWLWGPGKHSMLAQTYGSDAEGEPWRAFHVFYWHPLRKQICLLGLDPFARGVSEGTISFEGETAVATMDLYQTGQHRSMGFRWTFDGPDKYHAKLLEDTGSGFAPLVEWDYVRFEARSSMRPARAGDAPRPSQRLEALEPLLEGTWSAMGSWDSAEAVSLETEFEWVPYADAIQVRVSAPTADGRPLHLFDAYLYHHTGTGALRCLALSNRGGVYEGDIEVLERGALQLDLNGYEIDRVVEYSARIDFESDGALRHRVWSLESQDRQLLLDTRHEQLEPGKN